MKNSKTVLLGAILLASLTLISCKKKYECICYYPDGTSVTHELKGTSISELEAECLQICN